MAWIGVMLVLAASQLGASGQCVKVRLTNCYARTVTVAYGPATLCAEARVQQDPQHRWLEMSLEYAPPDRTAADAALDQDDPLREVEAQDGPVPASLIQLDGAEERIRHERKYRDLYGGTYLLTATTYTDDSRKTVCGRASARVIVR